MTLNKMNDGIVSDLANGVSNHFVSELVRAGNRGIALIEPVKLDAYRTASLEFGNDVELLNDGLIDREVERLGNEAYLESMFPPGYVCCPAVFTFSDMGGALDQEEIERGDHIRPLLIDPKSGETLSGFGTKPSLIFNLLPDEIRPLAFKIPVYDFKNRAPFLNAYRASLVRLREIMQS